MMGVNAIVNLVTERIYGAKKGKLSWWHEVGHIVFNQTSLGSRAGFYHQGFLLAALYSLVVHLFYDARFVRLVALSSLVLSLLLELFEEGWCWVFAFKIRRKLEESWVGEEIMSFNEEEIIDAVKKIYT